MKPSRERIITWAREAGIDEELPHVEVAYRTQWFSCTAEELERFYELAIARAGESEPVPRPHLFELWWAEYMPEATQEQAWKAWEAAPRADGVGVVNPVAYLNGGVYGPIPNPATAGNVRKPMTDDQIDDLHGEANRGFDIERAHYFKAFRDAEKAHGITDKEQQSVQRFDRNTEALRQHGEQDEP